MRSLRICATVGLTALLLAACGKGSSSSSSSSSTTTPLPSGCPPQTILAINTGSGTVKVAAATRKAVVRSNTISVYLFSNQTKQSDADFTKFIGSSFRIDGTGAMLADGKNTAGPAPTEGTYTASSKAKLQLVGYSVQQDNKLLTSTPTKPAASARMEITHLDATLVCGKIEGEQGSTSFIADRINA